MLETNAQLQNQKINCTTVSVLISARVSVEDEEQGLTMKEMEEEHPLMTIKESEETSF